ncbi:MAG: hypothetical protein ACYC6Z_05130 [Thermoleophilia bacterium]
MGTSQSDIMKRFGPILLSSTLEPLGRDLGQHIPLEFLTDVLEGLRDPVSLRAWESHSNDCEICQANLSAFAAPDKILNPIKFAVDFALPSTSRQEEQSDWAKPYRRWLATCIRDFGARGRIAAGESNCDVYTEDILKLMREVLDEELHRGNPSGEKMQMVTGPILSVREGPGPRKNRTIITEIASHDLFELFYSRYRQRFHFRTSSTAQRLYYESEHNTADKDREPKFVVEGDMSVVTMFSLRFGRLRSDRLIEQCQGDPVTMFAFMTNEELTALWDEVYRLHEEEGGPEYGNMLDDELFQIADKLGIVYDGNAT